MKKHDLLKDGNNIIRVLEVKPDKILMIDCIKRTMHIWWIVLDSFFDCTGDEVNEGTGFIVTLLDYLIEGQYIS